MSKRLSYMGLACGAAALCLGLSGCQANVDDSILSGKADYSINIALPYVTVTPPPSSGEAAQALVIDAEGSVTVNDTTGLLRDFESAESETSEGNYKTLSLGNTGIAVQALQNRLQSLGYFTQGISGIFDANTETAVKRFEQTYGTMQTGVATPKLQARLFSSDALAYSSEAYTSAVVSQYEILERGDVGSTVYALQQRLRNLNYPVSELTGVYDNETANAVMLFYESYGLSASDIATVDMQKELYSDSARSYGNSPSDNTDASEFVQDNTGVSVTDVQARLIELGYMEGEASGVLDSKTGIAIKLFETACGQLPSGTLSSDLESVLASDSAIRFSDAFGAKYVNLIEGSSGSEVSAMQARLVALGYAAGTPNGDYGSATTAAIKLFQNYNGMDQTGAATAYVQAVLYSSFALNIEGSTIAESSASPQATDAAPEASTAPDNAPAPAGYEALTDGSEGEAVVSLQNRLTELGFVSSMTGVYDDLTRRAVENFQTCIGLSPDGVADSDLLLFLYSDAAPISSRSFYSEAQSFTALQQGDSGDEVTQLQKRLWELGYLAKNDIADSVGSYNGATAAAVQAVKAALNYASTSGVADPALQCFLYCSYSDGLKDLAN